MKPNRQEFIYNKLLRAWQNEHKFRKLNPIQNHDCFLEDIRDLIHEIKTSMDTETRSTIRNINDKSIDMIRYMVSDLLDLREEKILAATKSLKKIDENALFEVEKQFYRQLFTAFRGYSKGKKMLVDGILTNGALPVNPDDESNLSRTTPSPIDSIPKSDNILKETPAFDQEIDQEFDQNEEPEINEILEMAPPITPSFTSTSTPDSTKNSSDNFLEESKPTQSTLNTPSTKDTSESSHLSPKKTNNPLAHTTSSSNFIILRILHHVEPLVGSDMKIYGPLEPGNIVFLPKINADILIEENFAKPIIF